MKKIEWTKGIKDEIQRQAEQPPCVLVSEDRDHVLQNVGPEHQVEVEEYFNGLSTQTEEERWNYLVTSLEALTRSVKENERFQKPILRMDEAAAFMGISEKRLNNVISDERKRLMGRNPDFIVKGTFGLIVLRDKFVEWLAKGKTKPNRRKSA